MQLEVGSVHEGKVTGITKFGAFVELADGVTGMVHISEVADTFVSEIRDHLTEGQTVKVKVLSVGADAKIALSIKKATPPVRSAPRAPAPKVTGPGDFEWQPRKQENASFESMMTRFKQDSEEKMSGMKRPPANRRSGGPSHRKPD